MSKLYLIDSQNISFQPQTCEEAIILFNRLKARGKLGSWDNIPELLQKLARDLSPDEHDRFANWICNPNGFTPNKVDPYFGKLEEQLRENIPKQTIVSQDDEKYRN